MTESTSIDKEVAGATDGYIQTLIGRDKEASEIAKVVLVHALIMRDAATDLSESHIAHMSILTAINDRIDSTFITSFLTAFVLYRKSLGRKSRKEFVEMFKSLRDEDESRMGRVKELLSGAFS